MFLKSLTAYVNFICNKELLRVNDLYASKAEEVSWSIGERQMISVSHFLFYLLAKCVFDLFCFCFWFLLLNYHLELSFNIHSKLLFNLFTFYFYRFEFWAMVQPPWQPVMNSPVAIPAAAPQLISIGNFDAANKAQIAQIAHHNAQILRQIKGLHPPVTQYLNPFPVFPSANSPKHVVMTASAMPAAPHSNQLNQCTFIYLLILMQFKMSWNWNKINLYKHLYLKSANRSNHTTFTVEQFECGPNGDATNRHEVIFER